MMTHSHILQDITNRHNHQKNIQRPNNDLDDQEEIIAQDAPSGPEKENIGRSLPIQPYNPTDRQNLAILGRGLLGRVL